MARSTLHTTDTHPSSLSLLTAAWTFISPFRWHMACLTAVLMLSIPLGLLTPLPLTVAVDSIIGTRPLSPALRAWIPPDVASSGTAMLVLVAAAYIAIALCNHLQAMALWILSSYTGERLIYSFRSRLFEHLQRICVSYHDVHGPSDSVYRIQHDAASVKQIPIDALLPFLRACCMLTGLATLMLVIDREFALVGLSMLPVLFWLTRRCGHRLRRRWSEVKKTETATLACAQEVLAASRLVKAFGREDHEQRRFLSHAMDWVRQHNAIASIASGFDLKFGMTVAIGTAVALVIGLDHVKSGRISTGDLLLLMAYMAQLAGPLDTAAKKIAELQSHLVGFRRALAILAIPPVITDRPSCRPIDKAQGRIAFRAVSFAYPSSVPVLRDVSFSIPAGTRVGVVGPSGSGKSTLMNLLTRFYDPSAGAVLLDERDLRDYRLIDLRAQFSILPQDPQLFSTTIAENIRYGNLHATQAQLEAAAEAAHADAFIKSLPEGYETFVGERGCRLSGGQRQRIALARAFLRDAPIVILDEPTSALDAGTEADLVEVIRRLTAGRTTFIIAHRMHTLRHCDLQLLLRQGRVFLQSLDQEVETAYPLSGLRQTVGSRTL
ncbi:MAG TPA: ABC transporter ATP-binding protein [Nitrospira sp.]|nr:ABC transporter ATP-binding protein [Nitrospira sp.]